MSQDTLDDIKARAGVYQSVLRDALTALDHPDVTEELAAIKSKVELFQARIKALLGELTYPALDSEIARLLAAADAQQVQIRMAVGALGYPNLVDAYEKAQAKRDAYKEVAWQGLKDLDHLAQTHASDYAFRRKVELLKKLTEIEK